MLGNEIYHETYKDHDISILRSGQRYIGRVLYLDKVLYTDDGLRADPASTDSGGKQHLLAHLRWWTSYGKRRNTGNRPVASRRLSPVDSLRRQESEMALWK